MLKTQISKNKSNRSSGIWVGILIVILLCIVIIAIISACNRGRKQQPLQLVLSTNDNKAGDDPRYQVSELLINQANSILPSTAPADEVASTGPSCSTTYTDAIMSTYLPQLHNKILLSIKALGGNAVQPATFNTLCVGGPPPATATATGTYNNILFASPKPGPGCPINRIKLGSANQNLNIYLRNISNLVNVDVASSIVSTTVQCNTATTKNYKVTGKIILQDVKICSQYDTNPANPANPANLVNGYSIGTVSKCIINISYDVNLSLQGSTYTFALQNANITIDPNSVSAIVSTALCSMNNLFTILYVLDPNDPKLNCCPGGCTSSQPDTSWLQDCKSIVPDGFIKECSASPPKCQLATDISSALTTQINVQLVSSIKQIINTIPSLTIPSVISFPGGPSFADFLQVQGSFTWDRPLAWIEDALNKNVPDVYKQMMSTVNTNGLGTQIVNGIKNLASTLPKVTIFSTPSITVNTGSNPSLNITPNIKYQVLQLGTVNPIACTGASAVSKATCDTLNETINSISTGSISLECIADGIQNFGQLNSFDIKFAKLPDPNTLSKISVTGSLKLAGPININIQTKSTGYFALDTLEYLLTNQNIKIIIPDITANFSADISVVTTANDTYELNITNLKPTISIGTWVVEPWTTPSTHGTMSVAEYIDNFAKGCAQNMDTAINAVQTFMDTVKAAVITGCNTGPGAVARGKCVTENAGIASCIAGCALKPKTCPGLPVSSQEGQPHCCGLNCTGDEECKSGCAGDGQSGVCGISDTRWRLNAAQTECWGCSGSHPYYSSLYDADYSGTAGCAELGKKSPCNINRACCSASFVTPGYQGEYCVPYSIQAAPPYDWAVPCREACGKAADCDTVTNEAINSCENAGLNCNGCLWNSANTSRLQLEQLKSQFTTMGSNGHTQFTNNVYITPVNNLINNTINEQLVPIINSLLISNFPKFPSNLCLPAISNVPGSTPCSTASTFLFKNILNIPGKGPVPICCPT